MFNVAWQESIPWCKSMIILQTGVCNYPSWVDVLYSGLIGLGLGSKPILVIVLDFFTTWEWEHHDGIISNSYWMKEKKEEIWSRGILAIVLGLLKI